MGDKETGGDDKEEGGEREGVGSGDREKGGVGISYCGGKE